MERKARGRARLVIIPGGLTEGPRPRSGFGGEPPGDDGFVASTAVKKKRRYLVPGNRAQLRKAMARKCPGMVGELVAVCAKQSIDAYLVDEQIDLVLYVCYRTACEQGLGAGREALQQKITLIKDYVESAKRDPYGWDVV